LPSRTRIGFRVACRWAILETTADESLSFFAATPRTPDLTRMAITAQSCEFFPRLPRTHLTSLTAADRAVMMKPMICRIEMKLSITLPPIVTTMRDYVTECEQASVADT
jgi:hypothetical protein